MNILFVCSRNKCRSRTAEAIFKNDPNNNVKSAGTEKGSKVKINQKLIDWADLILVMENKHKDRLDKFNLSKNIVVLDIPDNYEYMDEELIEILKEAI